MFIKIILIFLLLVVVVSLFQALYVMLKNDEAGPKMSRFLGRRLLFSALVVLAILILLATGFITPNPRPY